MFCVESLWTPAAGRCGRQGPVARERQVQGTGASSAPTPSFSVLDRPLCSFANSLTFQPGPRRVGPASNVGPSRVWAGARHGVGRPPRAHLGGAGAWYARISTAAFKRAPRLTPSAPSYNLVPLPEPLLSGRRWAERARLTHNRTVQDVKFAPKHLGLKLVRRCLAPFGQKE